MNDLVKTETRAPIQASDVNPISMMFDAAISARVRAIAETMSIGKVSVPDHLRGNLGDCLAIVMQAASWRLNPYAVAQKTHLIHGKLGYEAQLVNAVVSSLGLLDGRFHYEYEGDWSRIEKAPIIKKGNRGDYPAPGWSEKDEAGLAIVVSARLRGDAEPKSHRLALAMVWPRSSTLWATNPQQQIAYLGVKQWVRKFAPDAILGVYTPDEIEQEHREMQTVTVSEASNGIMEAARQIEQKETVVATHETTQEAAAEDTEPDVPEAPAWPQEREDGTLVDADGIPWDKRFYAATKTCNADGTWRRRRGAKASDIEAYEAACTEPAQEQEQEKEKETDEEEHTQYEHRTVQIDLCTEPQMIGLINNAKGTDELKVLADRIEQHPGWDQTVKDDLLAKARDFYAEWQEVERQEQADADANATT